jgi:hypothetical protein
MHTRSGLLACAVVLVACASNPDPRTRPIELVQRDGHGGWIIIKRTTGPSIAGELIAVEPDALRVLDGVSLMAVPRAQIRRAEVWAWETQEGRVLGWGALGSLSTISHGFFLVFSFPVWLLTSTITSINESFASQLSYPGDRWEELVKWARFPQGLPARIGAAALIHQDRPPATTQSSGPGQPSQPTQPGQPTGPGQSTEPTGPGQPTQPTGAAQPTPEPPPFSWIPQIPPLRHDE